MKKITDRPQIVLLPLVALLCGCQGGSASSVDGNATGGPGLKANIYVWKTGTIKVRNPNPFPVAVWVDGRQVGYLAPGGYSPMSVSQGDHTVNLVDGYGRIVNEFEESTDR
jgi:hypothetical protein